MASQEEPPEISHPDPLIVPPKSGRHAQTFIILHGRGSNALAFGPELLINNITGLGVLPDLFPDAKFVFPTAARRPLKRFKGAAMQQWFDIWSVPRPDVDYEIQIEGLKESTQYIHGLLKDEVAVVGGKNVVLWGLSQGCAASLIASLLWSGESLAAVIGMCGWLPLLERMRTRLEAQSAVGADNPQSGEERLPKDQEDKHTRFDIGEVVQFLRGELQLPGDEVLGKAGDTPIFIGHGAEDNKVPAKLGEAAAEFLRSIGLSVQHAEYGGLGHWYADEMLRHIVEFLACKAGWPVKEP